MKRFLFLLLITSHTLTAQIFQLDVGNTTATSIASGGNPQYVRDATVEHGTYGFTLGVRPIPDARHAIYFTYINSRLAVGLHLEEEGVDTSRDRLIQANGRGDSHLYGLGYGYSLWTWRRRLIFEPVGYIHVQHAVETKSPGYSRFFESPFEPKYRATFYNRFHEGVAVVPAVGFNAGLRVIGGLSLQLSMRVRYAYRTTASGELEYWVRGVYGGQADYEINPTGFYAGLSVRYDWQSKKGM